VAAMGGRPRHAVVALSLPAEAPVELVDAIVDGMVAAAASCGAAVVGGDLSGGRNVSIAVAMVGTCDRSVGRSGASVGEAICVTGQLGGAAGGLRALRAGLVVGDGPPALQRLASRQLRPRARVDEGVALARIGAAAMIDVSDGLLLDLTRMARASGRGFAVDPETVPVDPDLAALKELSPEEVLVLASTGGEDFELLFTIEAGRVAAARAELASLNTPVTQIGVVTEGGRRFGQEDAEDLGELGWQHLRNP
jgi:thiamine-monophosphate kinase